MTKFDWLSLDDNEEVLWSGEPLMKSIYPAIAVGVPLIPVLGLGFLVMIGAYLNIKNTDFVVTQEGLYKKTGVLSRSVQKIGFEKVQNISFSQGVFGNYFGYGNVEISTAGGSGIEMRFNSIEDPKKIQQLINKRIKHGKKEDSDQIGSSDIKLLQEILGELKEINQKLE